MALLSAFSLIRAVSLFHITAAFFFLTAPAKIADQNVVFMLGEAMGLTHATTIDKPSEASAFIAVILAFLGIADLTAASMNESAGLDYWLANVPMRIAFLFGVTGYVFLFREDGMFGSGPSLASGVGGNLQNSMVFTWGFMELAAWFWIFNSLREERTQHINRLTERMKAEQDSM